MPKTINIYNKDNHYQHIEVIKRNRYKRHQYKEFFVEGVKPINQIVKSNWNIKAIIYDHSKPLSRWAKEILQSTKAKLHYELASNLMDELSDKEETSELLLIVEIPEDKLSRVKLGNIPLVIVLDRPSNPGNLGTIIRSCESFRADCIFITGHSVDLYDPRTIRASVGAMFSLPIIRLASHNDLKKWANEVKVLHPDISIIGSSAKADKVISKHNFTLPTILLLGNETTGLSENYKMLCDDIVTIPIYGSATSLNVGNAASILLYEIDRQRQRI